MAYRFDFTKLPFLKKLNLKQEIGAGFIIQERKVILGFGTGMGKTVIALAAYKWIDLYNKYKDNSKALLIVIAKKNSVFKWGGEIEACYPDNSVPFQVVNPSSKKEKRAQQYYQWNEHKPVIIMTYNTFVRDFGDVHNVAVVLSSKHPIVFIADECQVFKVWNTKTHRYITALQKLSKFCWGLTATPYHNNPLEWHGIMSAIDHSYAGGFWWYLNTFINYKMNDYTKQPIAHKFKPIKNPIEYYPFIFKKMLICEKMEGLPDLEYVNLEVDPHPSQSALIAEKSTTMKDNPYSNPLAFQQAKQQIIDSPEEFGFGFRSPKYDLLDDILPQLEHRKAIIYTCYLKPLHQIVNYLREKGIVTELIAGSVTSKNRTKVMHQFNDDPSLRAIVIDDAGGDSIDLQTADLLIFFTLPFSNIYFHQIVGRARRINSVHKRVEVVSLLCGESDYERQRSLGLKDGLKTQHNNHSYLTGVEL